MKKFNTAWYVTKIFLIIIASFVLIFGAIILGLWLSCDGHPIQIYNIGQEYAFNTFTVKVENDEVEQRFILYYTVTKEGQYSNSFTFDFGYKTFEHITNSKEFEYSTSDPDEIITFDENGFYYFYGSRTFYISYKNANEEIKNSIANKEFNLSFPLGPFEYLS
ncbi:MAG: hypothetical protein K2K38_02915 [Clostridia bacterium]|nr:hypothetical protein [Clostridia bacterium]